MSEEKDWSRRNKALAWLGFGIFFMLVIFAWWLEESFAQQLSMGDIQNIVDDESHELYGCEFVSISDGMTIPLEFRAESSIYAPNFEGRVIPLSGNTTHSQNTEVNDNESVFRFATEAIGGFQIMLTDNTGNLTNIYRDYFYRIEVSDANNRGNIEREAGSWNTDENSFCKIIEFTTSEPFKERTEEEILAITEKDRKKRDDAWDTKLKEIVASITILTVAFILLMVYVFGDKFLQFVNKGKAEAIAKKIQNLHMEEIKELRKTTEFVNKWFIQKGMELDRMKDIFVKLQIDWANHVRKNPDKDFKFDMKPYVQNPYIELFKKSKQEKLDLRKITTTVRSKFQTKDKDEKAEFIEEVVNSNSEELDKLYENWQKKASSNREDQDAFWKCQFILDEMNRRRSKDGRS